MKFTVLIPVVIFLSSLCSTTFAQDCLSPCSGPFNLGRLEAIVSGIRLFPMYNPETDQFENTFFQVSDIRSGSVSNDPLPRCSVLVNVMGQTNLFELSWPNNYPDSPSRSYLEPIPSTTK